jgi:hypothetical protein
MNLLKQALREKRNREAMEQRAHLDSLKLGDEIKVLERKLIPRLTEEIRFTATLDGRYRRLSTTSPGPDVRTREYRAVVETLRGGGPDVTYIHVQHWGSVWANAYGNKPGWEHTEGWHKFQVLQLLSSEVPEIDADSERGAILILLRALNGKKGLKLSRQEWAALNLLQERYQDQALKR